MRSAGLNQHFLRVGLVFTAIAANTWTSPVFGLVPEPGPSPSPSASLNPKTESPSNEGDEPKWIARIARPKDESARITALVLDSEEAVLTWEHEDFSKNPCARFSGTFSLAQTSLLDGTRILVNASPKEVSPIVLTAEFSDSPDVIARLVAVKPDGAVQTETVHIEVLNWDAFRAYTVKKVEETKSSGVKRIVLTPSLEYKHTGYTENGASVGTFGGVGLSIAGSYAFLPSRWGIAASVAFTALPVASSPSTHTVGFVDASAHATYATRWLPKIWQLGFEGGLRFSRMFTNPVGFGYSVLFYPEIYPTLRRKFSEEHAGRLYAKFVPFLNGGISFGSSVLAGGFGWEMKVAQKQALSLGLDASLLQSRFGLGSTYQLWTVAMSAGWIW